MFRVYCIELNRENQAEAEAILHEHWVNNDIDIKSLEHSRYRGSETVQYWFTSKCSDDVGVIVDELRAKGIELF